MKQLQYPFSNCNYQFHFNWIIDNWSFFARIAIWDTNALQTTQLALNPIESVRAGLRPIQPIQLNWAPRQEGPRTLEIRKK